MSESKAPPNSAARIGALQWRQVQRADQIVVGRFLFFALYRFFRRGFNLDRPNPRQPRGRPRRGKRRLLRESAMDGDDAARQNGGENAVNGGSTIGHICLA
jgi:hypothetical protein